MLSENDLRERGIGKTIQDLFSPEWHVKRRHYKHVGVWERYVAWERYFRYRNKNVDGSFDNKTKNEKCQLKIDQYLLAQVRGDKTYRLLMPEGHVEKEKVVTKEKSVDKPVDDLMSIEDLPEETGKVDMIETITYVFQNMDVDKIDPKDAPSRGAYFYLMRIRKDVTAKNKFYEQGLMKLVPSSAQLKETSKKNDDGRETFELLDRLLRECANS